MIRLNDALVLALTKLRTRRIRTTVTVIIASLLFGVLAVALLLLQGGVDSLKRFTSSGLSERYLAMVNYSPDRLMGPDAPAEVKGRAQEIYAQLIADKKAAAKRLGIEYDPTMEQKPLMHIDGDGDWLDASSPAAVQAYAEYFATLPTAKQTVDDAVAPYSPAKMYEVTSGRARDGQLKPIVDGKEDFEKSAQPGPDMSKWGVESGWLFMDESVTAPFMLPADQLAHQSDPTAIPVIAPLWKVESALGLAALPADATPSQKLERLRYVKAHAETATFTVCYRNAVSQQQIDEAIRVAKDIAQNKANKDYQRPSLQYGLPVPGDCAPATVLRDARSATEKELASKQRQFAAEFGQMTEPVQQKLTFRVVGLSPNGWTGESFSGVDSILNVIAGSTLEGQWVVPRQQFAAMPNYPQLASLIEQPSQSADRIQFDSDQRLVEFNSVAEVKRFVDKLGCGMPYCEPGQPSATYFGSNAVLIDDIRDKTTTALGYVAAVVTAIASLIMMGMIGRVIGDSRRETAVFRAIGATRNDIRLVYTGYTVLLATIIAIASLALGLLAALWINAKLSGDFTVRAHLIYLFSDDALRFDLVGFWWQALVALIGLIILAGLIGMLLPLSRNLARSPIKDMRDDT